MKKLIFALPIILASCTNIKRDLKSFNSSVSGLERSIVLMNYNGDTLETWKGRYLITSDSANGLYFDDENNKRITIHGGIVVSKEL